MFCKCFNFNEINFLEKLQTNEKVSILIRLNPYTFRIYGKYINVDIRNH